jgi:hypothetical protein
MPVLFLFHLIFPINNGIAPLVLNNLYRERIGAMADRRVRFREASCRSRLLIAILHIGLSALSELALPMAGDSLILGNRHALGDIRPVDDDLPCWHGTSHDHPVEQRGSLRKHINDSQ